MLNKARVLFRPLKALWGFYYDFVRFVKYSGWRFDFSDSDLRNYYLAMVYHSLEKSLSFKERKQGSGWKDAETIFRVLISSANKPLNESDRCHDHAAVLVLLKFINLDSNKDDPRAKKIRDGISELKYRLRDISCGSEEKTANDFYSGKLESPERFFLSRYSLREFSERRVENAVVERAVNLAIKTPSVCNRQSWHVYHIADPDVRDEALKYQSGNRGFGHKIPNLLVVCADLRGFFTGQERYQHWIDGGLFSMSLIYALHSLGVGSCCLNWSQSPEFDIKFRSVIDIDPHHSVIMMIAIGFPDETNKVCVSPRRPIEEVLTHLGK